MKNRKLIFGKWIKENVRTAAEIAAEHKQSDANCGRDWNSDDGCGCAACRTERKKAHGLGV